MGLYRYQLETLKKVWKKFETSNKVCLAASCSSGKTFISIKFICEYLKKNPDNKVLILTHGQTILRGQFYNNCKEFDQNCEKLPPIFKSTLIERVSELTKYKTHNVLIAIPQSIQNLKKFPKFDLIIIDEGHQFYFAKMVQDIIKRSKVKMQLILTGTPSTYIRHKWPIVSVAMNTLLPEYISDVIVELCASSYLTKYKDYDHKRGEIKNKVLGRILKTKDTENTLDDLLDFIYKRVKSLRRKKGNLINEPLNWFSALQKLQKTMIACKSRSQARDVQKYFEKRNIKALTSISGSEEFGQDAQQAQETFDLFKTDKEILVLIVVGRGIIGFNYPDLANVVDMTCSFNIDRIFQLMSRVIRKPQSKKVPQKLFLKIVPKMFEGYNGNDYFHYIMTAVLCLTDEHWFTHFNGTNFMTLDLPRTMTRSKKDYTQKPFEIKKPQYNKLKIPVAPNYLGIPSITFFKEIWHKDERGNYSYEFTTLGYVTKKIFDLKDNEDESNKMSHEVCKWVIAHNGKMPYVKSKDSKEKSYGTWLSNKRHVKSVRIRPFYDSDQKIAESYDLNNLFEGRNLEEESNEMCHKVCKWILVHDEKRPNARSKNSKERSYGIWLSNKHHIKSNGKGPFYNNDQKIAESYGLKDIFETQNLEKKSNEMCHKVCKWVITHNRKMPNARSKNSKEKSYGIWLSHSKAKLGKRSFYDSDQNIAESYELNDIFETQDLEKKSNEMCHKVCKWVIAHNRKMPDKRAKDPEEKSYGTWLSNRRKAKLRKRPFYNSDQKIADSYELNDLFKTQNLEEKSDEICHKVCVWKKAHNDRNPSKHSKDPEEKKLGLWLTRNRRASQGKNTTAFYKSNQKIAKNYGYPDLFRTKK